MAPTDWTGAVSRLLTAAGLLAWLLGVDALGHADTWPWSRALAGLVVVALAAAALIYHHRRSR